MEEIGRGQPVLSTLSKPNAITRFWMPVARIVTLKVKSKCILLPKNTCHVKFDCISRISLSSMANKYFFLTVDLLNSEEVDAFLNFILFFIIRMSH